MKDDACFSAMEEGPVEAALADYFDRLDRDEHIEKKNFEQKETEKTEGREMECESLFPPFPPVQFFSSSFSVPSVSSVVKCPTAFSCE